MLRQLCTTLKVLTAALFLSLSCTPENNGGAASRPYYLGLTPFPFDILEIENVYYVYDKIETDADLIAHHFDNGIPWDEALAGTDHTTYPDKVQGDWYFRKTHTPAGHKVYVAVTPLNGMRNDLAPIWNTTGDNQPLTGTDWDGLAFNSANVKTAYLNYCISIIEYFDPDYFAFGVEVNLLRHQNESEWSAYVELHVATYNALKERYPDLPLFVTLTGGDLVDDYSECDHAGQMAALGDIMDYTDYFAISIHPFFAEIPGASIPADMFDKIFSLNTGHKPACITETSFPAEVLIMTAYDPDITFAGTPEKQVEYFNLLLNESEDLNLVFVVNFLVRDYDVLWATTLGAPEDINKAWRDTGLYDEDGDARPVLDVWKTYLARPVR